MAEEKTFLKITNKDIYEKLLHIEEQTMKINGSVKLHRKWLSIGTGTISTIFLFVLTLIFRGVK